MMVRWRWWGFFTTTLVLGMLAVSLGAGCSQRASGAPIIHTPEFDQMRAWNDLKHQVAFGYRIPGTKAHRQTRDWLEAQLSAMAPVVHLQPFTHMHQGHPVQMWNIIATIPGNGPAPRESVLLGAHWDTRPFADQDPIPANRSIPIAGANDGASGVAVLLEIARQLKADPIGRDVTIVLFDGEDYGHNVDEMLLGSAYYAAHLPKDKPSWGILLDMIGDKDLDIYREPDSEVHAKAVNDRVFRAAHELGYIRTDGVSGFVDELYQYSITDDHTPINAAGVPMADLIDFDYPPWHTVGDTVDKCSADSLKIVGKTVLYALQMN